jgi:lysyl endopeptidase
MRLNAPTVGCTAFLLSLSCGLMASAGLTKPAKVQMGVDGHGPLMIQAQDEQEPALTRAMAAGIDMVPPPAVMLGPIDDAGLILEDDAAEVIGPRRFSIQRKLSLDMADGQWMQVEGGSVWRVDVEGLGSLNTRLHLSGLDLGEGEELFLSSPGDPDSVMGPLTGVGLFDNGEAWGVFTRGAVARIEWFVPEGRAATKLPFQGAEYAHGYRDMFTPTHLQPRADTGDKASGCVIDPACYAEWADISNAAGAMVFTSGGGSYVCSGQLIATTAVDETPLFLTANHCISTTAEANSLQVRFFYRATTCNGTVSNGTNVVGADLLSAYAGSDCTLVMLRATLPSAVYWAGWQNTNPASGTASAGIHHPNGVEQDISFGTKGILEKICTTGSLTNSGSRVNYSTGLTEGGSSGSGIYVTSTKRLYGVLSCGPTTSSCTNLLYGQYGRLDMAMTNSAAFAGFMAAGSDDAQEPNDSCASPRVLTAGTYSGLVVKRVDEDWYAIDMEPGAQLSLSSTYTHSYGDVDFQLFANCGDATAVASNTANVNNATLNFTNSTGAARRYYLRVYLGSDTRNDYSLTVGLTVPPPVNNECNAAISTGAAALAFNTTYATNSAVAIPSSCHAGGSTTINKDLWYQFVVECTGEASVSTCGAAGFDTSLVVYPGTSCPTASTAVVACNDNGTGCASSTSTVTWPVIEGESYYIRLGSPSNTGGTGTITLGCTAAPPPCPSDLDGNAIVDSGDIASLLLAFGECGARNNCPADLDASGTVDAGDIATLLLGFGNCP